MTEQGDLHISVTAFNETYTPAKAIIAFAGILCDQSFGSLGHPEYVRLARDIVASGEHLIEYLDRLKTKASVSVS